LVAGSSPSKRIGGILKGSCGGWGDGLAAGISLGLGFSGFRSGWLAGTLAPPVSLDSTFSGFRSGAFIGGDGFSDSTGAVALGFGDPGFKTFNRASALPTGGSAAASWTEMSAASKTTDFPGLSALTTFFFMVPSFSETFAVKACIVSATSFVTGAFLDKVREDSFRTFGRVEATGFLRVAVLRVEARGLAVDFLGAFRAAVFLPAALRFFIHPGDQVPSSAAER
jgi:hypothetical protein